MKARIKETDLSVPFRKDGRWFYSRTEEGQQYPILCRTDIEPPADLPRATPCPGEQVLLDLNVLAGDSDYFALGAYDLAPGQDLLLYSTDHDGSERYTMRIRDLRTGDRPRRRASPTPSTGRRGRATTPSSTCAPTPRCGRTRCGGTRSARPPSDDVLVFEEPDERFYVGVGPQPHRGSGCTSRRARSSRRRST